MTQCIGPNGYMEPYCSTACMNSHKTKYAKSQSKFQVFGKFKNFNNINNFLTISSLFMLILNHINGLFLSSH